MLIIFYFDIINFFVFCKEFNEYFEWVYSDDLYLNKYLTDLILLFYAAGTDLFFYKYKLKICVTIQ